MILPEDLVLLLEDVVSGRHDGELNILDCVSKNPKISKIKFSLEKFKNESTSR